ncbi:MAG: hypothetical protein GY757_23635 [bacterium]|nr:hypothetical protein [bacterium]
MAIDVDFSFDNKTYRHYINGFLSVLHCHHYLCLTSKMAEDFEAIGGQKILQESAEDSIRPILDDYLHKNTVVSFEEKLTVGAHYYSVMGLGKMRIRVREPNGEVELLRSHIDQGWIQKWGKYHKHINFFTCGYIAAIFAAATDNVARSYKVTEINSIVTGSETSLFSAKVIL